MKIITATLKEQLAQVKQRTAALTDPKIEQTVRAIIENVQQNGDEALRDYEQKFDQVKLDDFRVPQAQIDQAWEQIDADLKQALRVAKTNITSFHQQEIDNGFMDAARPGIIRGQKVIPLATVGLYVPGGTAAYPSSVLMSAIPAKIAGVKRLVMVTPPQKKRN